MARFLTILLILAVVAGGGYFGLNYYSDHRLHQALNEAIEHLPPDYAATYQSAHYGMLTDRGTVGGIRIQHNGKPRFATTIDELDIDHPNWDLNNGWTKAAANPGTLPEDTVLPVAAKIEAHGVSYETDTGKGSTDGESIDGFRIYPWSLLRPGLPTMADALAALARQPPQPTDMLMLFKLDAALGVAFGYDALSLRHVHGTATIPPTPATDSQAATPGGTVEYSADGATAGRAERGVSDDFAVTGIKFAMGLGGGGSIDRLHMDHMDFRRPATALLTSTELTPALANGLSLGDIGYDGVKISMTGHPPVVMAGFDITNIAVANGVPISGAMTLRSLQLSAEQIPDPRTAAVFDALGLKTMTVSFGLGYRWDVAAKRVDLQGTNVKIDELGTLTLDGTAGAMDPAGDWRHMATLDHALLRYVDASLAERLLKYGAKMMATDEAGMRDLAIKTVSGGAAAFVKSPELQAAAQQVVTFLKAPQNFTIELKPPAPVPFTTLETAASTPPPQLATMLGLQVRANTPQ